jgi:hypothetical protein
MISVTQLHRHGADERRRPVMSGSDGSYWINGPKNSRQLHLRGRLVSLEFNTMTLAASLVATY